MKKSKFKFCYNKKALIKTIRSLSYIFYGLLILFALVIIFSKFSVGGIRLFAVQSGSMVPTIRVGSVVFVKPRNEYRKDDIITFYNSAFKKETTTHRIIEIKEKFGSVFLRTKGDANNAPDSDLVPLDRVLGKAMFSIPYAGYLVAFIRTLPGLIFLIIIPAVLIIAEEILKIKKELYLWKRRKFSN